MELKPGMSALVTGGASGIGKALCIAFARRGLFVTVVDFSEENGREVATLVQKENSKFHGDLRVPSSIFVKCDVSNADNLAACFEKHVHMYSGLDICINCAGIVNKTLIYDDTSDGTRTWRHAVNVNLVAVIDGTRIASQIMRNQKKPGVIINIGSAAGLYPMIFDPIYSATKGGVVMFTRSLAPLKRHGVRVNVLCPEFVQTNMAEQVSRKIIDSTGGYLKMEDVVNGAFELIQDESKAGACLWITKRRGMEYWPTPEERRKYMVNPNKSKGMLTNNIYPIIRMPEFFEKIVVHTLSHNFRDATRLERVQLRFPIKAHSALVKIIYAGVNASDVNFSSGRYFSGNPKETASRLPFDAGFEGVGIVAAVGDSATHIKVGTPVALMTFGSYAEFTEVPAKHLLPVPRPDPEVVAMLTSGLTASIGLEKAGQMTSGQVVLVTAAAGGTGQVSLISKPAVREQILFYRKQLAYELKHESNDHPSTSTQYIDESPLHVYSARPPSGSSRSPLHDLSSTKTPSVSGISSSTSSDSLGGSKPNAGKEDTLSSSLGLNAEQEDAEVHNKPKRKRTKTDKTEVKTPVVRQRLHTETAHSLCDLVLKADPNNESNLITLNSLVMTIKECATFLSGGSATLEMLKETLTLFAVQLAKLAGNKVVATCGGESKAELLASLGVDRVINYRNERVKDVLKKEFPRGVDIIYESVGGEMFDLCLNALAVHGHLIVIGMISQYQGEVGWKPKNYTGLCEKILAKSQTVAGFFLVQYAHLWQDHLNKLFDLYASGKLKVSLDPKKFVGVTSVPDAVEYLHSGKSVGKVIVCIDPSYSQIVAKL